MNPLAILGNQQRAEPTLAQHFTGSIGSPVSSEMTLESAVTMGLRVDSMISFCVRTLLGHLRKINYRVVDDQKAPVEQPRAREVEAAIAVPSPHDPPAWSKDLLVGVWAAGYLLKGYGAGKVLRVGAPGKMKAVGIQPLNPDQAKPIPADDRAAMSLVPDLYKPKGWVSNGWLDFWELTNRGAPMNYAPAEDIIYVPDMPDPLKPWVGHSRMTALAEEITQRRLMNVGRSTLLRNHSQFPHILEHPGTVDEQVAQRFHERHEGPENTGKTLHVEQGQKLISTAWNPKELEWSVSLDQLTVIVARAFNLLPGRLMPVAMTYENLRTSLSHEVEHGALPIANAIADALTVRLLTKEERQAGWRVQADIAAFRELLERRLEALEVWAKVYGRGIPPDQLAEMLDIPWQGYEDSDKPWISDEFAPYLGQADLSGLDEDDL